MLIYSITIDEARLFCKNATNLKVLELRPIEDEYDAKRSLLHERCSEVSQSGDETNKRLLDFYLTLRACERFNDEKGRYPGTNGVPEQLDSKVNFLIFNRKMYCSIDPISRLILITQLRKFLGEVASFFSPKFRCTFVERP